MARCLRRRARLVSNSPPQSGLLAQRVLLAAVVCLSVLLTGCADPGSDAVVLTADLPLHLEDHLDAATIEGSEVPTDLPEAVEWRFDEPQPEWRPAKPVSAQWEAVKPVRADDALRLPLTAGNRAGGPLIGQIYVDLADWNLQDWGYVEIRARTQDRMRGIGLLFNYTEEDPALGPFLPFNSRGELAPLVTDGTVQTYRLSLDAPRTGRWDGPWTQLGIGFISQADAEAATLDILSVRVIPREAEFAVDRAGVRMERRGMQSTPYRRTVYTHAPGRIAFRVRTPEEGRLDVGGC